MRCRDEDSGIAVEWPNATLFETRKSKLQTVEIFKTEKHGFALVIDGELQHIEQLSAFYHEPLIHIPMSFIERPRHALILGGGDLFAAQELLRYNCIETVDIVDHDPNVIAAMCDHYSHSKNVISDSRIKFHFEDACKFLGRKQSKFDFIVNDCFDTFSRNMNEFNARVESSLSPTGIYADLIYRSIFNAQLTGTATHFLQSKKNKALSLVFVPEYAGFIHVLIMWGNNENLHQSQRVVKNLDQLSLGFQSLAIYEPNNLPYYLYLPPYIRNVFGYSEKVSSEC